MTQKSYKHWVLNDGSDMEDGDGRQLSSQGNGGQSSNLGNGAGGSQIIRRMMVRGEWGGEMEGEAKEEEVSGGGEGEEVFGGGEEGKGGTEEDIGVMEGELSFILIFFNSQCI